MCKSATAYAPRATSCTAKRLPAAASPPLAPLEKAPVRALFLWPDARPCARHIRPRLLQGKRPSFEAAKRPAPSPQWRRDGALPAWRQDISPAGALWPNVFRPPHLPGADDAGGEQKRPSSQVPIQRSLSFLMCAQAAAACGHEALSGSLLSGRLAGSGAGVRGGHACPALVCPAQGLRFLRGVCSRMVLQAGRGRGRCHVAQGLLRKQAAPGGQGRAKGKKTGGSHASAQVSHRKWQWRPARRPGGLRVAADGRQARAGPAWRLGGSAAQRLSTMLSRCTISGSAA